MRNPLFYLLAFALFFNYATPVKAENPTPSPSPQARRGEVSSEVLGVPKPALDVLANLSEDTQTKPDFSRHLENLTPQPPSLVGKGGEIESLSPLLPFSPRRFQRTGTPKANGEASYVGERFSKSPEKSETKQGVLSLAERLKSVRISDSLRDSSASRIRGDLHERLLQHWEAAKSSEKQDSIWRQRLKPAPSQDDIDFRSPLSPLKKGGTSSQKVPQERANENIQPPKSETSRLEVAAELEKKTKDFSVFPVGLNLGKRNVNPSMMIRGQEDGTQAINFENWLLPFDDVVQGLDFDLKNLPDGQIEVRSPGFVTRIDPKKLRNDSQLGLVFSIQDLDTLFGIKAKFNLIEYAIELDLPWLNQSGSRIGSTEPPIILEGLPRISPDIFSFGAIEQKVNASGSQGASNSYRGDLLAIGSAFGGSWFLRTDQPNFQDANSWRISEAQFLRQSNQADYILGSQPTFWRSQGASDYWGFTYIQRQGFVPPQQFSGYFDPRQRLQSAQIGRTITGRAEPGTLVRLVEAFGDRIIGEVLVDSSGIYRFENVKSNNQYFGSSYRVLLYPDGRLTAQPEIREATYSVVPGQLPAGASAFVVSGGLRRDFGNQSLLGDFSDFRGGISQRWGLSENLTVGLGGVYDESARGLAELFYRPANLPLQVAVSALTGNKWDVNADIRFNPTRSLSAAYTRDRFSSRFNLDWRVFPGLSLFATTDSRNATAGGVQLNFSGRNAFTFARMSLDTENRLRWTLLQRLGALELNQRGNEIGTLSELSFNLSRDSSFLNLGNSLLLSYETRATNSNNLLSLGWRYRSPQRASDGNYLWEAQLGYGIGSQGSGAIASLATTVIPGIMLRARYQGVTVTSDESSFNIDLVSSLGLQRGITPGDRRSDYLRTQGGLLIQPFYDQNNNGKQDAGEAFYTENADTLLVVNNRVIKSLQPEIKSDRILVRLNPGTYRLDLDPAGFPEDWQVTSDAYAVDVVAGSYTPILLPLTPAYTFSGVLTDSKGQPINGARVEAISKNNPQVRLFSVTNTAGVYYLQRLQQGTYDLFINDKPVGGVPIKLDSSSIAFQELNLQQSENQEFQAINPNGNQGALPNSVKD